MPNATLDRIADWDRRTMLRILRGRNPAVTAFLRPLTWTAWGGAWGVLVVACVAILRSGIFPADRAFVAGILRASAGPGISWIFVTLAKRKWRRKPPSEAIEGCDRRPRAPESDSFPSGHSAAAFAFFSGLLCLGHPAAGVAGLWAIGIAYSRMYLGVHYLSDVLVGAAFGAVLGAILASVALPALF
jgi:undecaprenyl-diphosphatase